MNGIETLRMPAGLPAGFSIGFANLASLSGALPISHFQVARIGLDTKPAPQLPLILAIDGRARPESAPGLTGRRSEPALTAGYEADWLLLQDLMDMPPSSVGGASTDPMDLVLARDAGWFESGSLREILANKSLSPSAYSFFAKAFGLAAGETFSPSSPATELRVEKDFLEYAAKRFLEGAFLARISRIEEEAAVETAFVQSAMGFALSDRYSAAAMMLEHAVNIQCRAGRPCVQTRIEEAKIWLAELGRGDRESFDAVYPRALNAAQHDHPGSGLLERIFDASAEHYVALEDFTEAAKAFLRKAWARMMALETEGAQKLSPEDWTAAAGSLAASASCFERGGLETFSLLAETLGKKVPEIGLAGRDSPRIEIISSRPPRLEEPTLSLRRPEQ